MSIQLLTRQYGPLSMLERPPDNGGNGTTVILLHGLGANAWDLAPLADRIDPDGAIRWLFPQAPTSLSESAGRIAVSGNDYRPEVARAWFPRTTEELSAALFGSYFSTIANQDTPWLVDAADELIAGLTEASGGQTSLSGVVVGGFSQGAMVAVEAVLRSKESPRALVVLSGNLMAADRWNASFSSYAARHSEETVSYFQSHGTSDPILSYQNARDLNDMLTHAGFVGEFHAFPGGHWVPDEVLWSLAEFLFSL